jgi:hypothetical protein
MNGLKYHTVNDLSVQLQKFKLINTIEHNGRAVGAVRILTTKLYYGIQR